MTPELRRVLDGWMPRPAFVLDRHWNFEVLNDAARVVFGYGENDRNCLVTFFTSTRYRSVIGSWAEKAPDLVAEFRADAARFPDDPRFERLATKLSAASPVFAELWRRHDVRDNPHGVKTILNSDVGEMAFEFTALPLADRPGDRLFLFNPKPGTSTRANLNKLMAGLRLVDAG
ncbi:hypothetical protein [Actinomadura sp. HBU206391]|uniref:MmyB family transcriptional regulator n=1 Tax=Actinomadura sp. HBU206391 TaxID=2731692 RepID=UPI0029059504|nr:hypothetical protein [Actinomadura sp. HBU206391]